MKPQNLGSLSASGGGITYTIPSADVLLGVEDNATNISITITLLNNEVIRNKCCTAYNYKV